MSTVVELAPVRLGIDRPRGDHVPPEPLRRRLRIRLGADGLIITAIAVIACTVRLLNLFGFPALADDEGTYVAQAQAVRWGELAHYTYWYDHPPLGWIQLGALDWIPQHLLPGVQPVAASRIISVLAATVSTVLIYVLSRRIGCGQVAATLAGLAGALSPLAVTLERQVYLDTFAAAWMMASFVLAHDAKRRLWAHVGAGICFGIAVLTKETTAVILPALLWAVLANSGRRTRWFSIIGSLGAFFLVVAYYPLMALLRGELLTGPGHVSLMQGVLFQLHGRDGSGAIWKAGSASNQILHGWLFFDPWIMVAGVVAIPIALLVKRFRPVAAATLIMVLVGVRPSGYLPAMYVLTMIPFLAVTAGAGGEAVGRLLRRPRSQALRRPLCAAGVLALAGSLVVLAPDWAAALRGAYTQQTNTTREQAEAWMAAHIPRSSVVLTDDVSWVKLVQHHVTERENTIWFYKLDTDPGVKPQFPDGWRDVDYVLSTDQLRLAVAGNPSLTNSAAALANSVVVASFGSADSVVEVLQVTHHSTAERTARSVAKDQP